MKTLDFDSFRYIIYYLYLCIKYKKYCFNLKQFKDDSNALHKAFSWKAAG